MSLKMNFLIIFIIVLTTFVKMVPAPRSNHRFAGYKSDDIFGKKLEVYVKNKNSVTKDSLEKFADMYKTEISGYLKKNQIEINGENMSNLSAALLYFKDIFNEFNRYKNINYFGSNVIIRYMILRKEDNDYEELKNSVNLYKKLEDKVLRSFYEITTSCTLQTEIEDKLFLGQLQFEFNMFNAQRLANFKNKISIEEFINYPVEEEPNDLYLINFKFEFDSKEEYVNFVKLYIKELHLFDKTNFVSDKFDDIKDIDSHWSSEIQNREIKHTDDNIYELKITNGVKPFAAKKFIIKQFINFSFAWQFYGIDEDIFFQFLLLKKRFEKDLNTDEIITISVDRVSKISMTSLGAFLHYFKESLDHCHNINYFDINELTETQRTQYYRQMLKGMLFIYVACWKEEITKILEVSKFVELMINVAVLIQDKQQSNKTENIPTEEEYQPESADENVPTEEEYQPESADENDGIVVEDNHYKYDGQNLFLPKKVNFKDVLDYLIVKNVIFENNTRLDMAEKSTN